MLTGLGNAIDSTFIGECLKENLITLLIALLAINTTTSSVVTTKLKEIADTIGGNFKFTIEQLKLSICEHVVLIVIAAIVLILAGSKVALGIHAWMPLILNGVVASVFVAGLYALFDAAKSIFVILRYENQDE